MRHPLFYPVLLLLCGALTFSVIGCGDTSDDPPVEEAECTTNEDCQADGSTMICNEDGECVPDETLDESDVGVDDDGDTGPDEDGDADIEDDLCEDGRVKEDEICDGIDNDCDGIIDNVEGRGEECDTGLEGVCAAGTMECVPDNTELVCVPVNEPSEEVCDGQDNDCDGIIDNVEGVGEECDTGLEGVCAAGVLQCDPEGSGELVCVQLVMPSEEICDGLDNDCNGLVDDIEGLGEGCDVPGQFGVCAEGVLVCDPDVSPVAFCLQLGEASDEVCDGRDNDCDGIVDNVPGAGAYCDTGLAGVCKDGEYQCDPEGGDELVCTQVNFPSEEICDGLDNSCNGNTDAVDPLLVLVPCENQLGVCAGSMKPAHLCVAGEWLPCDEDIYMAHDPYNYGPEICDGFDNTCNGLVDGQDPDIQVGLCENQEGACQGAVQTGENCVGGVWQPCTAVQYTANAPGIYGVEVCDGIDNDCDGTVDNVANLGGDCNTGLLGNCATGEWTCDGAPGPDMICEQTVFPQEEICDGQDNSCNGLIDAEDPELNLVLCEKQAGVCDGSRKPADLCVGGQWLPCNETVYENYSANYGDEVCDGLDNNCSGLVDADDPTLVISELCENQKGVCQGAMKLANLCQDGQWVECGNAEYQSNHPAYGPEICDGLDNNCSGKIDSQDPELVRVLCENQLGVCHGSLKPSNLCVGGNWRSCTDSDYEEHSDDYSLIEVCNGLDNNCDGVVDNIAPVECDVTIAGSGGSLCTMSSTGFLDCEPSSTPGEYDYICAPYLRLLDDTDVNCGTFTRSSWATFVGEDGRINTVFNDEPRFQWDETINDYAFLYEGERKNLLAYTTNMWDWNSNQAFIDRDSSDDMAGYGDYYSGGSWDVYYEAINARVWREIGQAQPGVYTASFYAKGDSCPGFYLDRLTNTSNNNLYVNLTNDWERYIFAYELTAADSSGVHGLVFRNNTRPQGLGLSEVMAKLWGVQIEEGTFPTSYIPTENTAVTRQADRLTYASNVLRTDMGTYTAWFKPLYTSANGQGEEYELLRIDAGKVLYFDSVQSQLVCSVGNVTASMNVSFDENNDWLFAGCSWSPEGVRVFASVNGGDSEPTYVFESGNAVLSSNVGGVRVAPIYALSKDVRIYRRHLPVDDITGIFAEGTETFRP